jgi:hypothetical protein
MITKREHVVTWFVMVRWSDLWWCKWWSKMSDRHPNKESYWLLDEKHFCYLTTDLFSQVREFLEFFRSVNWYFHLFTYLDRGYSRFTPHEKQLLCAWMKGGCNSRLFVERFYSFVQGRKYLESFRSCKWYSYLFACSHHTNISYCMAAWERV